MKFEPLYLRVKERLRGDLRSAQVSRGLVRAPTLDELQKQYQVSRPTISKALAALAAEGVLVKEPGRGMFALTAALDADVLPFPARAAIGYIAPPSTELSWHSRSFPASTRSRTGVIFGF